MVALIALGLGAAPASGASLGVYVGAADPTGVDAYDQWLEREPTYAIDFLASGSWSQISDPIWWLDGWQGSPYHVVFSVPMIPNDGSTLEQGALGAYDHHFTRLAQNLVEYGYGDATIRLGWEMNGNWFAWSGQADPGSFITYWRNAVDAMRAVSGSSFRFDWNPIAGGSFPVDALYPGDAWVDVIGLDVYDQGLVGRLGRSAQPLARDHVSALRPCLASRLCSGPRQADELPRVWPERQSGASRRRRQSAFHREDVRVDRTQQGERRVLRVLRVRRPDR